MKLILLMISLIFQLNLFAQTTQQKKMMNYIDSVASIFDSMYAPANWKKEFSQWSLDSEVQKAHEKILNNPKMTLKQFQQLLTAFLASMKDYHVSISFYSTESAKLPFTIRGAEGKYFFAFIDRTKLPVDDFSYEVGDELVSFNGKKVVEEINFIKKEIGSNVDLTDQALAEYNLTSRRGSRGHTVPKGAVVLGIKSQGSDKVTFHQLNWEYTAESIKSPSSFSFFPFSNDEKVFSHKIEKFEMSSFVAKEMAMEAQTTNLFALGSKKSFIPELGSKIWQSSNDSSFDAYIYLNEMKKLIGYIRIPSYSAGEKESKEFAAIMKKFQKDTDALVIDQINNPGGSVFYLYSLVSMLTDSSFHTPKHYVSINQEMVADAISSLKQLEQVKTKSDLSSLFPTGTISGYPATMTFVQFMKTYYQTIIDEWNAGNRLSAPMHLYGVDMINPNPDVNYTKPIVLLVNELDFSGGDFFPAILQDNKRVQILGTRTAGAGGYVEAVNFANPWAVESFRFTGSLADRIDHSPIENLGVKPDVSYTLTADDYQNKFSSYVKKIKEVVNSL